MRITILTLFPGMFDGFLRESIIGRAIKEKKLEVDVVDLRNWGIGKHKSVDDTPYGGGAGMVLRVDVVASAIEALKSKSQITNNKQVQNSKLETRNSKIILMTPQGQKLDQQKAQGLSDDLISGKCDLILVCGHYEGFDERIREYADEEISIGDYVLTGGELAAAVVVDAVARLIPGVLGKEESHQNESFSSESLTSHLSPKTLLEHAHYTRPEEFEGKKVPDILLSGHHKNIESWRQENSLKKTKERRPDLLN